MTMETAGSSSDRPRWVYPVLITSLALNLLIAGGFGAAMWHHRHGGGRFGHGGDKGMMGFVRDLPADRQKLVRDDIGAARKTIRPLRDAVQEAFKDSSTALTVEPFDAAKFKASMERLGEAESRLKSAMAAALGDTASKLTIDERRQLQNWREKMRPGFGRHGRDDGDADRGGGADSKDKE